MKRNDRETAISTAHEMRLIAAELIEKSNQLFNDPSRKSIQELHLAASMGTSCCSNAEQKLLDLLMNPQQ